MLTKRKVGSEDSAFTFVRLKYGDNSTDTVSGVIIYPDDFSFVDAGVATMAMGPRTPVQIDATTWEALEDVGCIFLPTAGSRGFTLDKQLSMNETDFGAIAVFWSSSAYSASHAFSTYFFLSAKVINPTNSLSRFNGFPVRLVQDL